MSSREQANAFRKHRDADDKQGNLAWASRVGSRALRVSTEAAHKDIEGSFELSELEKIVWRLLKLPRRYTDLEHSGLFEQDALRSVLRGFVAADVVDIVDSSEAKVLLPAEIKRLRAEVQGKSWRPAVGALQAKVYRPDIGLDPSSSSSPTASAVPVSSSSPPSTPSPTFEVLLSPDEERLKAQLIGAASAMAKLDHYAFLGVKKGCDDATVRAAYVQLARDYHPDRLAGTNLVNDPEAKNAVDLLFKRLGEAQKTVGNAEGRARYDHELKLRQSSASEVSGEVKRPRRPVEARNAYAMAETFFKRKEFKQAEVHYRQAVMFDAEEPMLQVALAWCIYLNPEHGEAQRIQDAKKRFEELVKTTKNGDAYYKYGRILRDAGDEGGAYRAFERAVERSPGHVDAQRELRLAQSRREKEEQARKDDKSLVGKLGKMFKKD